MPDILKPRIDTWLDHWRLLFLAPGDALWPSTKGGALAYTYVGTVITRTTLHGLGVAVNPHLFRACLVETIAIHDGSWMGIASAALQHTDRRTTETHYNKGMMVSAAGNYLAVVEQMIAEQ